MISPIDIRIGNKVALAHESNIPIVTIQEIRSKGVFAFIHGDSRDNFYSFEQLIPIELTPEWCEKVGGIPCNGTPFYEIDLKQNRGEIKINPTEGVGRGMVWLTHHRNESTQLNPNSIFHLHQLQNLYYALTGEELTIKTT